MGIAAMLAAMAKMSIPSIALVMALQLFLTWDVLTHPSVWPSRWAGSNANAQAAHFITENRVALMDIAATHVAMENIIIQIIALVAVWPCIFQILFSGAWNQRSSWTYQLVSVLRPVWNQLTAMTFRQGATKSHNIGNVWVLFASGYHGMLSTSK